MRRSPLPLLSLLALGLLLAAPASPLLADEPAALDKANDALGDLRRRQADVVRTLLASGDDRSVAWGATWARELSLAEVEPELVSLLRDEVRDPDAVGYYGMLAVFDALVHLDAPLEAGDLAPFLKRRHGRGRDHAAPAVVLAARSANPEVRLAVFDVLDADDGSWEEAWVAMGNVLQATATPGFAARLLRALDVELTISVTDHERISGRGRSVSLRGGAGDGRLPPHEGYPVVYRLGLTFYGRSGDVLLAPGTRPVYRTRRAAQRGFGTTSGTQFRPRSRFEWIAAILDTRPDDLPLPPSRHATVRWTSAEAFLADVAVQRRLLDDAFRELASVLELAGAVTASEVRGLGPRVRIFVLDVRDDRTVPLPHVEGEVEER